MIYRCAPGRSSIVVTRSSLILARVTVAATLVAWIVGCGGDNSGPPGRASDTTCDGKIDGTTYITAWFHVTTSRDRPNAERDTGEHPEKAQVSSRERMNDALGKLVYSHRRRNATVRILD